MIKGVTSKLDNSHKNHSLPSTQPYSRSVESIQRKEAKAREEKKKEMKKVVPSEKEYYNAKRFQVVLNTLAHIHELALQVQTDANAVLHIRADLQPLEKSHRALKQAIDKITKHLTREITRLEKKELYDPNNMTHLLSPASSKGSKGSK